MIYISTFTTKYRQMVNYFQKIWIYAPVNNNILSLYKGNDKVYGIYLIYGSKLPVRIVVIKYTTGAFR